MQIAQDRLQVNPFTFKFMAYNMIWNLYHMQDWIQDFAKERTVQPVKCKAQAF